MATAGTRLEETVTLEEKEKAPRRLSPKESALRTLHELATGRDGRA